MASSTLETAKYKYNFFKICQVQAQALHILKCLNPSTSTHMKYLSTFKRMTPLINTLN